MFRHKKLLISALIVFAVLYIWKQPSQAGTTVQKGFSTVQTAGDRAATFVTAVLR